MNPTHRPSRIASLGAILSGLVALGLPSLSPALAQEADATTPPPAANESVASTESSESTEATESTEAADEGAADEEPADAAEEEEAAEDEEVALDPEPGEYRNWFNVSVGGLIVDGNKAAAQQRTRLPASAFGGVEEFHFEKDVGKSGLFKIDGRGIFGNEDYRLRLDYTDSDKGFVRGGISQYREYYDGSGGWLPRGNTWFDLYDDQFEILRGNAFFEAGLRLPNIPEITVRYDRDYRQGRKDSTSWGDTSLTGVGPRSIVPSFWQIDETTDTVRFDIRHTLGKSTFGGGFTYQHGDIDNSRYMRRSPGEAGDRHISQKERVERDAYSARAFVDTTFNEHFRLTSAYLYTTLETDLGGGRVLGADYDPVYDPVYARRDIGFLNLTGGSQLDQHIWNVNLMWNPVPTVSIVPAFRLEHQALDGSSSWLDTGAENVARAAANSRDMLDVSQQLEARYTGVTNVVLYVRGDWNQGDGNLLERQVATATGTPELFRDSDFDRFSQKYTAGAHWYPLERLNLHAQYYRKMRENRFDKTGANAVNLYGLYPDYLRAQDFTTDDLNFRVTWRPIDKLTLVTRYDFQLSTIDQRVDSRSEQQSAESTTHILGETITWAPLSRLYLQPSVNYVLDTTRSAATGYAPLEPARNDYFNVNCTVGFVLDDRTDLQAQYSYYLADNFNDVSTITQPYGAGTEEHGILATLIRRISPRLRLTLRYGFYTSRSEMAGGFNDYDAHLVYTSAQYLF